MSAAAFQAASGSHSCVNSQMLFVCRLYRTWHRPFSVDLQEATFNSLRQFI